MEKQRSVRVNGGSDTRAVKDTDVDVRTLTKVDINTAAKFLGCESNAALNERPPPQQSFRCSGLTLGAGESFSVLIVIFEGGASMSLNYGSIGGEIECFVEWEAEMDDGAQAAQNDLLQGKDGDAAAVEVDTGVPEQKDVVHAGEMLGKEDTKQNMGFTLPSDQVCRRPATHEARVLLKPRNCSAEGNFEIEVGRRGIVTVTFANKYSWFSERSIRYEIVLSYGAKRRAISGLIPALRSASVILAAKAAAAAEEATSAYERVEACREQLRVAEADAAHILDLKAKAEARAERSVSRVRGALLQSLELKAQLNLVQFLSMADVMSWKQTCQDYTKTW